MTEQFHADRARFKEKRAQVRKERRRRRLAQLRNVAAAAMVATSVVAVEYIAVSNQTPSQPNQPSCLESPMTCNWDFPTATPVTIPDRQMTPPTTIDRRR
jgi:hypothetical protein